MFGMFIGTVCLIGLGVVAARRHRFGHHFRGHGHGGPFRRRALRFLFRRLETSPAQEKAILEAVDSFRDLVKGVKEDARAVRKDVASAFRAEQIDPPAFGALFDTPLGAVSELRDEFAATAARIHDILTPNQRQRLADLIETGPGFRSHGCHHGHQHAL